MILSRKVDKRRDADVQDQFTSAGRKCLDVGVPSPIATTKVDAAGESGKPHTGIHTPRLRPLMEGGSRHRVACQVSLNPARKPVRWRVLLPVRRLRVSMSGIQNDSTRHADND